MVDGAWLPHGHDNLFKGEILFIDYKPSIIPYRYLLLHPLTQKFIIISAIYSYKYWTINKNRFFYKMIKF